MKRMLVLLLAGAMALSFAQAVADDFYLIEDSDTRRLTEEELWAFDYDALGYVLNEIFARYGYHFQPDGKYARYFGSQDWYQENTRYASNDEITGRYLTNVEWYNERLVKDVREDMKEMGTANPDGMSIDEARHRAKYGTQLRFYELGWTPNKKLNVYSGPGKGYLRGADGKASAVMGEGTMYIAGRLDNWLLIMYWNSLGVSRVGYVNEDELGYKVEAATLVLDKTPAVLRRDAVLTDDAMAYESTLATLPAGTQVTRLAVYGDLAYVETVCQGRPVRGFVQAGDLMI